MRVLVRTPVRFQRTVEEPGEPDADRDGGELGPAARRGQRGFEMGQVKGLEHGPLR
jgi:hypothetical protein